MRGLFRRVMTTVLSVYLSLGAVPWSSAHDCPDNHGDTTAEQLSKSASFVQRHHDNGLSTNYQTDACCQAVHCGAMIAARASDLLGAAYGFLVLANPDQRVADRQRSGSIFRPPKLL